MAVVFVTSDCHHFDILHKCVPKGSIIQVKGYIESLWQNAGSSTDPLFLEHQKAKYP
jgi:hypothetical protein